MRSSAVISVASFSTHRPPLLWNMRKCKRVIVAACIHPHKEKFYGVALKQSKSYTLLAGHRIYTHTKSIEAVILEYEEIGQTA